MRRKILIASVLPGVPGVPDMSDYLTIEALEDGLTASLSVNACEYCVDGDGNWKSLAANTATESINSGHTLSFRGELTPNSSDGIGTFTISKKCNLKGNCMSMLFGDAGKDKYSLSGKTYAFYKLFNDCANIVNISENFLPATTLANYCYGYMFYACSKLTTAPALPATTLASHCYRSMFSGCTSLTTAPELPATKLANYCYNRMFYTCSSLTTAPELPATTLASYCYDNMFYNCFSLTTAPELPALTLANYCYNGMFSSCISLVNAPELPATTLEYACYNYMFYNCTNLTIAPELPAITLAGYCYNGMFRGCSKLNYIKMLATDISVIECLTTWVQNVASTGTFIKNPEATWDVVGDSGVPSGWTVKFDGEDINKTINTITIKFYWDDAFFDGNGYATSMFPVTSDVSIRDESFNYLIPIAKGNTTGTDKLMYPPDSYSSPIVEPQEDDTYIYKVIIEQ